MTRLSTTRVMGGAFRKEAQECNFQAGFPPMTGGKKGQAEGGKKKKGIGRVLSLRASLIVRIGERRMKRTQLTAWRHTFDLPVRWWCWGGGGEKRTRREKRKKKKKKTQTRRGGKGEGKPVRLQASGVAIVIRNKKKK